MKNYVLLLVAMFMLAGCGGEQTANTPATSESVATDTPAPTEPVSPPDVVDLLDRGVVRVGINDLPLMPFAIPGDGPTEGFEIDLAQAVVQSAFGDELAIEWVPVSAENRLDAIREGEIDLLIRATTHTESREADALWTVPYFLDGQRVLVSTESGIVALSDLAGETVCVNLGTGWETNLNAYMDAAGIPIETLEMGDDGIPFFQGQCPAVTLDWSLLMHLGLFFNMMEGESPAWVSIGEFIISDVEGEQLGYEPFAIGVRPDAPGVHDAVNEALVGLIEDGTWQGLYDEWMPEDPLWTAQELLTAPPAER